LYANSHPRSAPRRPVCSVDGPGQTRHASYCYPDDGCPPHRLAEATVPIQSYDPGFDPSEALRKGTMFPSLYRPEFVVPCTSHCQYVATRFPRKGYYK